MDPSSSWGVNFSDRVRQMASRDPDGTVRQIADYLLRTQTKVEIKNDVPKTENRE